MSKLKIYAQQQPDVVLQTLTDYEPIRAQLQALGVGFERWSAAETLTMDASSEDVKMAFAKPIAALCQKFGFKSVDVVSMHPEHPQRQEMREKFLSEHTHDDFEVRYFVDGEGLFYLHVGDKVYAVLCCKGDLINLPAGIQHWFDMGARPTFKAIRFFSTPDGWVANFTGESIAEIFPRLEAPNY